MLVRVYIFECSSDGNCSVNTRDHMSNNTLYIYTNNLVVFGVDWLAWPVYDDKLGIFGVDCFESK